eukprot:gene4584-3317_t
MGPTIPVVQWPPRARMKEDGLSGLVQIAAFRLLLTLSLTAQPPKGACLR